MFSLLCDLVLATTILASRALAQFAPYDAANLTTVSSPVDPGVTISYKEPKGVCKTAFDEQKQYTGWVHVPGEFPTNVFFWFVAGREPTSALTIWLNGGPGSSSMVGFFTETGPCEVIEQGANRLGTAARDWGWDRASNMLFIDQPNQVGFSYDTPTNQSLDLVYGSYTDPPKPLPHYSSPSLFLNGTFSSNDPSKTANSSSIAAMAIWHMLQGFLGTFPEYNPPANTSLGVSLFAESYGGKYGPVFSEIWQEQNAKRQNGSLANSTLDIHLTALGIVSGCVDDMIQAPYLTEMMVNNSYGLQLLTPVAAGLANGSFYAPDGCRDKIAACHNLTSSLDPKNRDEVSNADDVCSDATRTCNQLYGPYSQTGRSFYDITHQLPESFPSSLYLEYLNNRSVQTAIGSIVNFTSNSSPVYNAFAMTGDFQRQPLVPKLAALLSRGVRIGLIYGDRDYICNWLGGEAISLSIASTAGGVYAANFPSAGYAPIIVNDSYIGGVVRQFGNLSFSRIYQAGHLVPAYQPETTFQVFARIILGTSVGTGEPIDLNKFNTTGPDHASASFSLPSSPSPTCYIRAIESTCPQDARASILDDEGVIINGIWYPASSDWPGATMTTSTVVDQGGGAIATPSTTVPLTGVFTATSTPEVPNDNASSSIFGGKVGMMAVVSCCLASLLSIL